MGLLGHMVALFFVFVFLKKLMFFYTKPSVLKSKDHFCTTMPLLLDHDQHTTVFYQIEDTTSFKRILYVPLRKKKET